MVLTYLVLLPRSVLTVACEQTEVLLFDPISSKHIKTLTEAHEDCVNNIRWLSFSFFNDLRFTLRFLTAPSSCCLCRFLDNRLFATCSDDTTIALWDLRKLNSKVCSLHGHASWVKNIEYDTNTRLLVTSGFDGNVITWDMNRLVRVSVFNSKYWIYTPAYMTGLLVTSPTRWLYHRPVGCTTDLLVRPPTC